MQTESNMVQSTMYQPRSTIRSNWRQHSLGAVWILACFNVRDWVIHIYTYAHMCAHVYTNASLQSAFHDTYMDTHMHTYIYVHTKKLSNYIIEWGVWPGLPCWIRPWIRKSWFYVSDFWIACWQNYENIVRFYCIEQRLLKQFCYPFKIITLTLHSKHHCFTDHIGCTLLITSAEAERSFSGHDITGPAHTALAAPTFCLKMGVSNYVGVPDVILCNS